MSKQQYRPTAGYMEEVEFLHFTMQALPMTTSFS